MFERSNSASLRASMRSLLLPSLSRAFRRGLLGAPHSIATIRRYGIPIPILCGIGLEQHPSERLSIACRLVDGVGAASPGACTLEPLPAAPVSARSGRFRCSLSFGTDL